MAGGASNYYDVLRQMQDAGLDVDSLETGRWMRCQVIGGGREKRGWYRLHDLLLESGEEVLVGSFGVWHGNEQNSQKIELKKHALTAEQQAALRKRLAEDKKRAELLRKQDAERAAQRATAAWKQYSEQGECEYLISKGVQGHGVRYTSAGSMVIPVQDVHGNIHGLQIIRNRDQVKQGRMQKEYWPRGMIKLGHFHLIGSPSSGLILLAEGYATGASLFEATGICTAIAFDAGSLPIVAEALRKRWKRARILVCADDDSTQKCHAVDDDKTAESGRKTECKARVWLPDGPDCPTCGKPHLATNAGIISASTAAMQGGAAVAWVAPMFARPAVLRSDWLEHGRKFNDFNDLHIAEGLHVVRAQIDTRLLDLGWRGSTPAARKQEPEGGGEAPLKPIDSLDEMLTRFSVVYGLDAAVFDKTEHLLVPMTSLREITLGQHLFRTWRDHPDKRIVRKTEVGFDPSGADTNITSNLWAGWPTRPKAGNCECLLDLLHYMCKGDAAHENLYRWVIKWLAYPLQNPGAKMKSALVIHGPQGTGKNLFFEAIMSIYGPYGGVIDQQAIEDKFNEWASRKLFVIADEVLARTEVFHIKNRLKGFITGSTIRINPKNIGAYEEKNHLNVVFLSNEPMPLVLEDDDRRHAVIWTPPKLSKAFYDDVRAEIADGGVEALHDYLLRVDLAGFHEGAEPPVTDAKSDLINLGRDSPSLFHRAFVSGEIDGFPAEDSADGICSPVLTQDLYDLYCVWCRRTGNRSIALHRFYSFIKLRHGAAIVRKRYQDPEGYNVKGPVSVTFLKGSPEMSPGESETAWLGKRFSIFKMLLKEYKTGVFV